MPRPVAYPIKKLIGFAPELWEQIREYRFKARLNTESDAVRHLIERGLSADDKTPVRRAGPGGGSDQDADRGTLKPAPRTKPPAADRKANPAAAPRSKLDQIRALREQGAQR